MVTTARIGIGLISNLGLLLIICNGIAELVFVHEVVTRVVRRVNINHLDFAMIATLQELQHLEVVALDVNVVRVEGTVLAIAATALLGARAKRGGAHGLRLADGIGLARPCERIALPTLVDLVAELQPQFIEVDSTLGEHFGHQRLKLAQAVINQIFRFKIHLSYLAHETSS